MSRVIRFTGALLGFTVLLGTDFARGVPIQQEWLRHLWGDVLAAFGSGAVQKVEILCLALCAATLVLGLRRAFQKCAEVDLGASRSVCKAENFRKSCLAAFGAIGLFACFFGRSMKDSPGEAIALFWGLAFGQGLLLLWVDQGDPRRAVEAKRDVLEALIFVLTLSAVVRVDWWETFTYHTQRRWQGPWWNPNHFGLLMGTGLVLAMGEGVRRLRLGWRGSISFSARLRIALHLCAAGLMGVGLVGSYSRGAWLGTALAVAFWGYHIMSFTDPHPCNSAMHETARPRGTVRGRWFAPLVRNRLPIAAAVASASVLVFWAHRHTQNLSFRRALSVANMNDFSWRNRLVAYEGALQMMASRPGLGFGWREPPPAYDGLFRPSKLIEGKVIELNDYFMVGMALGLPALACFISYLLLSLQTPRTLEFDERARRAGLASNGDLEDQWLKASCRAGVTVLALGFWFDRGLFQLALTTPFWVLLELGREHSAYA